MADRYYPRRHGGDHERGPDAAGQPASTWGNPRSYSSDREYGDGDYGWRDGTREPGTGFSGEFGRQGYGGPYGRERYGAREWSSTEGWRVPGPHAGRGPRGYQRSDERIGEELHDRLTAHDGVDATDIECRVVDGEVTLSGHVDSRAEKRAAGDLAEDIYGVRQVNNQLRVRSHDERAGVGRTSVLGLTETEAPNTESSARPADHGRPRTRT